MESHERIYIHEKTSMFGSILVMLVFGLVDGCDDDNWISVWITMELDT